MAGYNMMGVELSPEANKKRRDALSSLGKDALRQMNPFRETQSTNPTINSGTNGTQSPPSATNPLAVMPKQSPGVPIKQNTGNTATNALATGNIEMIPAHTPGAVGSAGASTVARNQLAQLPQSQQFKTTMSNGMEYTADGNGGREYTMGTPGQDGYGRMTVSPGARVNPLATMPANMQLAQNGVQTKQVGGLTVTGSSDAVKQLSSPVGNVDYNSPQYQQFVAQNRAKAYVPPQVESSQQNPLAEMPKYLGPESGLGWKTRLGLYREQMDAYNKATGNKLAMDVEGMREAGAGARALLTAKGVNDANNIALQRLVGDQDVNKARIASEGINQQKGQMEIESAKTIQAARDSYLKNPTPENEAKYRAMIEKFEREAQYGTVAKYDDMGNKIGEDIYSKGTGEIKVKAGSDGKIITAPQKAIDDVNKNPALREQFKAKYGYLP